MKQVFADSVYFFARLNARDRIHEKEVQFSLRSGSHVITTAWILTEFGDGLANRNARQAFVRLLEILKSASDVEIIPPSQELFNKGAELFAQRPDKDWSLTDCISFVAMQERGIAEALTTDRHFEQAGFTALLK